MKASAQEYAESFRAFLSCTNEKKVLARTVSGIMRAAGASSLLDIGAGNGDMAVPLSREVRRYLAVERVPEHAAALRGAGLDVIESLFPTEIGERFDMVLVSHSLPRDPGKYQPFLRKARELLVPGGEIVLITYDAEKGAWKGFVEASGLVAYKPPVRETIPLFEFLVSTFSDVSIEMIETSVESKSEEEMMRALGFVYSDAVPERLELFLGSREARSELKKGFFIPGVGYSFPFMHYLSRMRR